VPVECRSYAWRRRTWYSSGAPFGFALAERRRRLRAPGREPGVTPRLMKWLEPSVVLAIASSTDVKPNGFAISTPATKLGIT
jgi:hypothetical protein